MSFTRKYKIIWADLDPNRHMRHTAYNDYAAQVRLEFFSANGADMNRLSELGIGPILFREDTRFYREVHMNETIEVSFELTKARKDGYKWSIRHSIFKESGELACTIDVDGAWLDLEKRKVTIPPAEIGDMLMKAARTDDFEWISEKKG